MALPSARFVRRIQGLLLFVLLAATFMVGRAQTITGSVRGTVTDPGGAVIRNAKVTVKNIATGITSITQTNDAGLYSVRFLPIGRYTVHVEATGFAAQVSAPFQLEIDQEATINVSLNMSNAQEQVTVRFDSAPILNTENATVAVTVDQQAIENMPMTGRDFTVTTVAIPGSIHSGGNMNEEPGINGNRQEQNSMILDGMDIYNQMNGVGFNSSSGAAYLPNTDALQEVRVISANANAEFGNVNGGQVIAVTKSGTNQFHGNAFFQLENYNMNANTWANKHQSGAPALLTPFTQTYFGGTVGGPILKDKLFFFADFQGYRYHQSGTMNASVVPAAMRNGDFSALPFQIYNSAGVPFGQKGQPNYNQIPVSQMSPVAQYLFSHPAAYPLPNATPTDGIALNNFQGPSNSYNHTDQGDVKIDWKASASDTLSGRFTMMNNISGTNATAIPATFPFSAAPVSYTSFVLNEVHVFSNNAINEVRVGFGRNRFQAGSPTDPSGLFGLKGNSMLGLGLPQALYVGFTQQQFQSGDITSVGVGGTGQIFDLNTFSYGDNFSWQHGRHLIKIGGEFLRYQTNFYYGGLNGALGTMKYSGNFSGKGAGGDAALTDFVLGYVDSVNTDSNTAETQAPGLFGQRQWRDGVFVQDDYKIRRNLTLNLGVRWDYIQPMYEVHNRETNVNLQTGALEYAGQNGNSRALYNAYHNQFQPRIGFSFSPTTRTVIRGGYGISSYFEGMGVNLRLTQNPPWKQAFTTQAVEPTATTPGQPLLISTGVPTTGYNSTGNTYQAWNPNNKPSITQSFSLTTEYQVSDSSSIQVGYVGETGQHLAVPEWANQWPGSCAGAATCAVAPFASSLGDTAVVKLTATEAMMNYNSLQVVYRKRASKGLDFTANYTWSKAMTNGGEGYNGIFSSSANYYQQDAFNLHAEYGPSPLDATHNVSGSLVYELPFGRGRRFASDWNRTAELFAGGWKISGLASAFSGNPLTINSPNNYGGLIHSAGSARADHLRALHAINRSTTNWFGTDPSAVPCILDASGATINGDPTQCAYSSEPYSAFGTAKNGSERGPGFENIDLSAFKAFNITEHQDIEFRADVFNGFNFASYGDPDTNVSDTNFGQITATRANPRTIQLGLSLHF